MPEQPSPNMVTQPQLTFLRTLAQQVTGDGGAHVAALTAADAPAFTAAAASAEITRLKALLASSAVKPPAAPKREEAPKIATQPQLALLRRVAHEVTGDGNGHMTAFEASQAGAVSTVAASAEINRLKALKASGQVKSQSPRRTEAATTIAPAGRYAVEVSSGSLLVEITKPTSGPWAGYTFVKTVPLIAEVTAEPVKGRVAVEVLKAIDENPRGCSGAFGRITGRCGMCNRRLSGPSSISLGIGPECISRFDAIPSHDAPFRRATGSQAPERF
jgi:hypothetical protein